MEWVGVAVNVLFKVLLLDQYILVDSNNDFSWDIEVVLNSKEVVSLF